MKRRAHLALAAVLLLGSGIAACAPVSVAQAERICLEDARAATGPRTEIAMGVGSDGRSVRPMGRVSVSVSADYITGRDPSVVYSECVMRRSGQMPSRPLYEQPGYRGRG